MAIEVENPTKAQLFKFIRELIYDGLVFQGGEHTRSEFLSYRFMNELIDQGRKTGYIQSRNDIQMLLKAAYNDPVELKNLIEDLHLLYQEIKVDLTKY